MKGEPIPMSELIDGIKNVPSGEKFISRLLEHAYASQVDAVFVANAIAEFLIDNIPASMN